MAEQGKNPPLALRLTGEYRRRLDIKASLKGVGPSTLARQILEEALEEPGENGNDFHLTRRQAEVLSLMAEGKNNKQIAEVLGVAVWTINNHVAMILLKLGASNRTEAALKWGAKHAKGGV